MAQTTDAGHYQALAGAIDGGDGHWSVPQAAMLVTAASGGLWALILAALGWLIG